MKTQKEFELMKTQKTKRAMKTQKPKRGQTARIRRGAFYRPDFHEPPFRLRLEWDGGPNLALERIIGQLCRKYYGRFEGSGCFMSEPYRRDYSITFENRHQYLAVRNYFLEQPFFQSILNESETFLLKVTGESDS